MLLEQIRLPIGATVQDTYGDYYRVVRHLGKGGSGTVYLVTDRRIKDHEFALKEIIDPSKHDRERLLFECEILKRLDHAALPHVYHVFENERLKRMYMLMAYIKGKDLEELRHEQPGKRFSLELALTILTPIVDALIYLHTQELPVVHRDIKPANIIVPLDGGEAVLVDFGTAKEYQQDGTTAIFRQGSPGYAAIEQYSAGNRTNMRTDVYGLGATLYTLLTGMTPIDAVTRITFEKGGDPLKPVIEVVPSIPRAASNAIQCALSIHNQSRFASISAFWQALHSDTFELPDPDAQVRSPETPLPVTSIDEALETVSPSLAPKSALLTMTRRGRMLLLALLVILTLGISSSGILLAITHHATRTTTPRSTQTATSKSTASPTSTTATQISVYPPIGQKYGGTIFDDGNAKQETPLYLTSIQQNGGNITGQFAGLDLIGTFTGTVSKDGVLYFTVKTYAGTVICKGNLKAGGDLIGSFTIVDQHGISTGEYGIWNLGPLSNS